MIQASVSIALTFWVICNTPISEGTVFRRSVSYVVSRPGTITIALSLGVVGQVHGLVVYLGSGKGRQRIGSDASANGGTLDGPHPVRIEKLRVEGHVVEAGAIHIPSFSRNDCSN